MTQQPEIPEGWERKGPCFIREHGGKLAVIDKHPHEDSWWASVFISGVGEKYINNFAPLPDAVAWANNQLGVPKPVEVVEVEHSDAWMLWSEQTGKSFRVSKSIMCRDYVDEDVAMSKAREYVRGAQ